MATNPTVLFLNLPTKTFIGINLTSFNSSPNFHGISNLSRGLHFVYSGTDASLSIRNGIWLDLRLSTADTSTRVLRWDQSLEHLELLEDSNVDAQRAVRRLPELQKRGLVDYAALREAQTNLLSESSNPRDVDNDQGDGTETVTDTDTDTDTDRYHWPKLTSHISTHLLTRVLSSQSSPTIAGWTLTSISSAPADTEHIPGLSSQETQSVLEHTQILHFLPIDLKQTWPNVAVGRERTDKARDRSWYLGHLIKSLQIPSVGIVEEGVPISQPQAAHELLGELEFCFLMVLCLANYSCLEQWKRILSVLFTCRTALLDAEPYFVEAIGILQQQLARVDDVEGGLFELSDETSSFWLRRLLKTFRANLDEGLDDTREKEKSKERGDNLNDALAGLEKWLRERFGWEDEKNVLRKGMLQLEDGELVELQADDLDEEEETGEYAPVIVDT